MESYYTVLSLIVNDFLIKKVNSYVRSSGYSVFVRLQLVSNSSKAELISYFSRYPIYGYKYLNYLDWVEVINTVADSSIYGEMRADRFNSIIANFNTNRTTFTWDHLDYFYAL